MDEKWAPIEGFPNYSVSDSGRIINDDTGRILKESKTKTGLVKIGLVRDGVQYMRGVAHLVAQAFIKEKNALFDTPMHLDNNSANNRVDNLVWRPRWFAWKYSRQFADQSSYHTQGPVLDVKAGIWYIDMLEAATAHGLLVEDVRRSIIFRKPVFPTRQIFSFEK